MSMKRKSVKCVISLFNDDNKGAHTLRERKEFGNKNMSVFLRGPHRPYRHIFV